MVKQVLLNQADEKARQHSSARYSNKHSNASDSEIDDLREKLPIDDLKQFLDFDKSLSKDKTLKSRLVSYAMLSVIKYVL